MSSSYILLGGRGHAKVVHSVLKKLGLDVLFALDDDPELVGRGVGLQEGMASGTHSSSRHPIIKGPIALSMVKGGAGLVHGIGDNRVRRDVVARFPDAIWPTFVHPSALVADGVTIGEGSVVMAGAILQPGVRVGRHSIINTGAIIDHDVRVGDFVHICPGVTMAGQVSVAEGAFIGTGTSVIPMMNIGAWSIVGAGSTVIHDVEAEYTVAGVPARNIH